MNMRRRLTDLSLRWQICGLTAIAILVALTIMGYLAFKRSGDIVTEMTLEKMMVATGQIASNVSNTIHQTRADVLTTPTFPPIPGMVRSWDNTLNPGQDPVQEGSNVDVWIQRLAQILTAQMTFHPERVYSAVYDNDGVGVMRVHARGKRIQLETDGLNNVANESFFIAGTAMRRGELYVASLDAESSGDSLIQICTPFFSEQSADKAAELRGLFVIALDSKRVFGRAIENPLAGQANSNLQIEVVDDTMQYLFASRGSTVESRVGVRYTDERLVRSQLLQSKVSSGAFDSQYDSYMKFIPSSERADGRSMLATYERIFYNAPEDESRYYAISASEFGDSALASVNDLGRSFLWIGCLVLLGVMVASYFASGVLTSSLAKLTRAADAIAGGEMDAKFPNVMKLGEVGRLDSSFRAMTSNLRSRIDQVRDQEARTQAIFKSAADSIVTLSNDGTILSCNAATSTIFGYAQSELVHQNASIICRALHDNGARYESRSLEPGKVRSFGRENEVMGIHRDGGEIPLALRVSEMNHAGEQLFIATLQNITQRKEGEQERSKLFIAIRDAVQRLTTASQQILATTSEQAAGAQQQAATVSQVVATAQEIAQSAAQAAQRANEVAQSARHTDEIGTAGLGAIEESVSAMTDVKDQVESIAENMLSLAERAQAISEITSTVNDIAEQTNILALNAAVEASRAGEHGKGFAVVAAEVKSLAEQSKRATSQVREILSEIQQATNAAVLSTEHGTRTVSQANTVIAKAGETIRALAGTLAQSAQAGAQISAAASQQAAGVGELNEGIRSIDTVSKQNVDAIQQIEQAARNLNELSSELASLTDA